MRIAFAKWYELKFIIIKWMPIINCIRCIQFGRLIDYDRSCELVRCRLLCSNLMIAAEFSKWKNKTKSAICIERLKRVIFATVYYNLCLLANSLEHRLIKDLKGFCWNEQRHNSKLYLSWLYLSESWLIRNPNTSNENTIRWLGWHQPIRLV